MSREGVRFSIPPNEDHEAHPRTLCFVIGEHIEEERRKRIEEYISTLQVVVHNPDLFLDQGGAGEVYAIHSSGFCIKLIPNRHKAHHADRYNLGNTAMQESVFQRRLGDVVVFGARAPVWLEVLEGQEYCAIVMEQLDAVNLEHVLQAQERLPEAFDLERFIDGLEGFVAEMHERGIAHGDLEARNVMLDRASGEARIIDFGRSVSLRHKDDPNTAQRLIDKDWDNCERIEARLRTLLAGGDN